MRLQDIEYEAEGTAMVGYLAVDEYRVGPRPCVLICHEGPGLDDHARSRAIRLASLGYLAFALDYLGGGKRKPLEEAMAVLGEFRSDRNKLRRVAQVGLDLMLAQEAADASRAAVIGYCFGGTMAIELARGGADLKAVVGFHAGFPTPAVEETRQIKGSLLMCVGAADPFCKTEDRHAFEADLIEAGVQWRMELYGGVGHSFTNPEANQLGRPGIGFDAEADRLSWLALLDLLQKCLGPI